MARTQRHNPIHDQHTRKNPYKRVELRRLVKDFERQYIKSNRDPIIHL